ncbi:MAG: permease, partial [Myxococcales bacterium]|nr:permease [Myxococcales bacterium]
MIVVGAGAALACLLATATGIGTTAEVLAEVPWDVLVILVTLGLLSEVFVHTRVFSRLAVALSERSAGDPRRLLPWLAIGMWAVSGLVNNLTALLLVLPVVHILLSLMGVTQRYASWTLGVMLVACNLGGAATPIGDFPAILLLGSGAMRFADYLVLALPPTVIALGLLVLAVQLVVRPAGREPKDALAARLSVATMRALHRGVKLERRRFALAAGLLSTMILAWTFAPADRGYGPELVAWLGVGALLATQGALGERLVRSRVDVEATLFLLALFVMVGVVRRAGVFGNVAEWLVALPVSPELQLVLFLVAAGVLTGLFSAGPSMAALLEVADVLTERLPAPAVYVGLALAVCAGSSLFLTAATSGPMAQALTERAGLRTASGEPLRFGFTNFLPVGLLAFTIILGVGIGWALVLARWGEVS